MVDVVHREGMTQLKEKNYLIGIPLPITGLLDQDLVKLITGDIFQILSTNGLVYDAMCAEDESKLTKLSDHSGRTFFRPVNRSREIFV